MSLKHRRKNVLAPESVLLKILGILMALLCYIHHLTCVKKKKLSEFLYKRQIYFCHLKLKYLSASLCVSDAETLGKVVKVELAVDLYGKVLKF